MKLKEEKISLIYTEVLLVFICIYIDNKYETSTNRYNFYLIAPERPYYNLIILDFYKFSISLIFYRCYIK